MNSKVTTDIDRTPVAKDIWCFSPKEKAFTWHVVINHDAKGYVDRVQCKVTGQIHKYKRQNKPEALRALRMIHYSAWVARRWEDPSFPKIFQNFGSDTWWREEIEALSECYEHLNS
jgi:hypothetical protein